MRVIISDIDMGGAKTFMVSREYLARLVIMLENGTPLPESQLTPVAVDLAVCTCKSNYLGWKMGTEKDCPVHKPPSR